MNAIRPVLLLVVLSGIGYAVYARLNAKPGNPPPGIAENWNDGLQVEMPGDPAGTPTKSAADAIPGSNLADAPPTWNSQGADTAAPRFPGTASPAEVEKAAELNRGLPPLRSDLPHNRAAASHDAPPFAAQPNAAAESAGDIDNRDTGSFGAPPDYTGAAETAPIGTAATGYDSRQFDIIMQAIQQELDQDHLPEALLQLTKLYEEPLSAAQQQQVVSLLDQLAGTVIYSTRSIVLPPHEVKAGETLESIATELQVPSQLLAKINGIDESGVLQPGERLKVVRGPFQAVVDLQKHEMTLRVGGMYAGRFAVGIGQDNPPPEGNYSVTEKVADPTFHGADRSAAAGDPANPLGTRWIGLGDRLGIHGSSAANAVDLQRARMPGSIALQPRDVEDAFDILSVGSRVTVRR